MPNNPTNVYNNNIIVTRELKHTLSKSSWSPELDDYIIHKFNRSESIPNTIWWEIHGKHIDKYFKNGK
jgi:hypothetical protein